MKISERSFKRAATDAEKNSEKDKKKAKEYLMKNDDENAKKYADSATQYLQQGNFQLILAKNYHNMVVKLRLLNGKVKSSSDNQAMMKQFGEIGKYMEMNQNDMPKLA